MKMVVTGGTGFIGSHLVKALLQQNKEVVVAADFAHLGIENLLNLGIKPADIETRRTDLTNYSHALAAVKGAGTVFHLAARVGNLAYLHGTKDAELDALQRNLMIDANVFRACREEGVRRLVYASSCAVYPMNQQLAPGAVFSESWLDVGNADLLTPRASNFVNRPMNPDGGYGWSKLLGEMQLNWTEGIDVGIGRIFNIYGENEPLGNKAHVVGDLVTRVVQHSGRKLVVQGNGSQSRDFLYVSDCIEALLKLEQRADSPPTVVNIGSGQGISIRTVAEKIVCFTGKDIGIVYDATKQVGPVSRTADITKAEAFLGWRPKVSLDDGLRHTYSWVQKKITEQIDR